MTPFTSRAFGFSEREGEIDDIIVAKAQFSLAPSLTAASEATLQATWMAGEEKLCVSDSFFGEINRSSVCTESDLAPFKPRCDVIVIGSAHSPTGKPVPRVAIGIDIVDSETSVLSNHLVVFGPREMIKRDAIDRVAAAIIWLASLGKVEAPEWLLSEAEPFVSAPVRYELAYGGEIKTYPDDGAAGRIKRINMLSEEEMKNHPEKKRPPIAHDICFENPVGCGYNTSWYIDATRMTRWPAPRIEAISAPFTAAVFIRGWI